MPRVFPSALDLSATSRPISNIINYSVKRVRGGGGGGGSKFHVNFATSHLPSLRSNGDFKQKFAIYYSFRGTFNIGASEMEMISLG